MIPKNDQKRIDGIVDQFKPTSAAELQYVLARNIVNFLTPGLGQTGMSRGQLLMAIGALYATAYSVEDHVLAPFERGEQLAYGDIYQVLVKKANLRTL
jgi:hypothetical protein